MAYNFCNDTYHLIATSMNVKIEHFSLALTVLEIFKFYYLENVGQGNDVQHSQWRHSMASTRLSI